MDMGTPQFSGPFRRMLERERGHFTEAKDDATLFTGVWSLAYIREACSYLAARAPQVTRHWMGCWRFIGARKRRV